MLAIRLSRLGTKKKPFYRVVVIEKSAARDGRSLEILGTYNPQSNPVQLELAVDRVDYWVSKGAQLSETVANLVKKAKAKAAAPAA